MQLKTLLTWTCDVADHDITQNVIGSSISVSRLSSRWWVSYWTSLVFRKAVWVALSYTGCSQKNGAILKVNKKRISHLTRAQLTPSAAATVQVSHALITILQCVPSSHRLAGDFAETPHALFQCCHQTHEVHQDSCLYTSIHFPQSVRTA
jgi:hypothetical protein